MNSFSSKLKTTLIMAALIMPVIITGNLCYSFTASAEALDSQWQGRRTEFDIGGGTII